jgi:NACHT domain
MSGASRPPRETSWTFRARFSVWLWRTLAFFWVTVVLGVGVNVAANWLTSPDGFPPNTPAGWLDHHLGLVFSLASGLFFLTVIIGLVNQGSATVALPVTSLTTDSQHTVLVEALYKECRKRLSQSLQQMPMISPDFRERTDLTRSTRQMVFGRTPVPAELQLGTGTSIAQIYDHAGLGFLLLGAPGSGKTTLLLELAVELLDRARQDASHPVTVILNLSSWTAARPPLATWLIAQLRLAYGLPTRLSRALLDQDRLVLLLDGLDEVVEARRVACIAAINAFRREHLVPLVVCSRDREYLAQKAHVALPTAVVVQPLGKEQVAEYLKQLGSPAAGLYQMLRDDRGLQGLTTTPLMLHVAIQAYHDEAAENLPGLGSWKERRQQIFNRYTDRMMSERNANWRFTPQQIQNWLVWLARQMATHPQTEFYLESIQPSWLPNGRTRQTYLWASRIVSGLIYGLAGMALVSGIIQLFMDSIDALMFGLVGGLSAGFAGGLRNGRPLEIGLVESLRWSWVRFRQGAILGLVGGLTYGALGGPLVWFTRGGLDGVVLLAILGGVLGLLVGKSLGNWLIGLLSGFLGGLVDGLIGQQLGAVRFGVLFGVAGGLTGAVLFGSLFAASGRPFPDDMRTKPNQGVLSSGRNGLRFGVLVGLFVGPTIGLYGLLIRPQVGLLVGLLLGLGLAVFFACEFGGKAYIDHYLLRLILAPSHVAPWHYGRLLQESVDRILMRRVGGGYSFIHSMFQEYFATQDADSAS